MPGFALGCCRLLGSALTQGSREHRGRTVQQLTLPGFLVVFWSLTCEWSCVLWVVVFQFLGELKSELCVFLESGGSQGVTHLRKVKSTLVHVGVMKPQAL